MCPNTEIPRFLQKSAPPVANEVVTPLIRKRAFKLTSNYEGLSIGRAKKKTLTEFTKIFGISQNKILNHFIRRKVSCETINRKYFTPKGSVREFQTRFRETNNSCVNYLTMG